MVALPKRQQRQPELDRLAQAINAAHEACISNGMGAVAHAVRAGQFLLQAKAKEPHGGWLAWFRANCSFSEDTAQVYMRLARRALQANTERARYLLAIGTIEEAAKLSTGISKYGLPDDGLLAEKKSLRGALSELREQKRTERLARQHAGATGLPLSERRYSVLYLDPPWRYEHVKTESRAIENQYPTMALEEICALPVAPLCAEHATLFMWTTSPKLAEAMRVLEAWQLTYRTCAVWVKSQLGMGYYFRQRHELLLVATRGEPPTPKPSNRPQSVIEAPRGKHSAKPTVVYDLIEKMYPDLPRIELFARTAREGWDRWGNEA
jgi:N6-adenosine-specific RNA methylase IME4